MMRRLVTTLLIAMTTLAACAPAATPTPSPTETSTPLPVATATPHPTATRASTSTGKRTVTFTTADGVTLHGTLYGQGNVAVIFSNMGDQRQDSWAAVAEAVAEQGYLTLTYDFRYWVNDKIDNALAKRVADDLSAAAAFVREQGAQKVVMVGASLGGMATAKAAASNEASAVIIIASPTEAPSLGLVVEISELQAITVPKLFIASESDRTVKAEALKQMYDLAVGPKELHLYPGAAHGTDIFKTENGSDLQARLIAFITSNAPTDESAFAVALTATAVQATPAPTSATLLTGSPLPETTTAPAAATSPAASATPQALLPSAEKKMSSRTGTAYTLAFSPDGKSIAVASGYEFSIVSADLQETRVVFAPPDIGLLGVTWSSDGLRLASVEGLRHPTIRIWNWDAAQQQIEPQSEFDGGADEYGVSWSPDGRTLATLANDRKSTFQLWNAMTWEKDRVLDLPYQNPRRALDWSADSTQLFDAGEANGEVVIFAVNLQDGNVTEFIKLPISDIEVFAVSPDAGKIAVADKDGMIHILDMAGGKELSAFQGTGEPVDLDWNPGGNQLAVLSYHATLQIWDVSRLLPGAP